MKEKGDSLGQWPAFSTTLWGGWEKGAPTLRLGTFEQVLYNRLNPELARDRLGRWTKTQHDALGRPVSIQDPLGRRTQLEWCNCGSLESMIDANGNVTTWMRDLAGRKRGQAKRGQAITNIVLYSTYAS